jgi:hypothetical protein
MKMPCFPYPYDCPYDSHDSRPQSEVQQVSETDISSCPVHISRLSQQSPTSTLGSLHWNYALASGFMLAELVLPSRTWADPSGSAHPPGIGPHSPVALPTSHWPMPCQPSSAWQCSCAIVGVLIAYLCPILMLLIIYISQSPPFPFRPCPYLTPVYSYLVPWFVDQLEYLVIFSLLDLLNFPPILTFRFHLLSVPPSICPGTCWDNWVNTYTKPWPTLLNIQITYSNISVQIGE